MDVFASCRIDFERFPKNLPTQDCPSSKIRAYLKRLDQQSEDLFDDENAQLGFFDNEHGTCGFRLQNATTLHDVGRLCPLNVCQQDQAPFGPLQCRFIFLYSRNSREALYTSREMLMLALSYHLVQSWFLDFLFPFGEQDEPLDARFTSFRSKTFLSAEELSLSLPRLRRSGCGYHLCYNLRAPEETTTVKQIPWSIRQAVMYHSFDVGNGQSFWLNLKGNDSMSKDLMEEAQRLVWQDPNGDETKTRVLSFVASLLMHLFMCEWARESWRSYIMYLEGRVAELTDLAVIQKFESRPMPKDKEYVPKRPKRTSTAATLLKRASWKPSLSRASTSVSKAPVGGQHPLDDLNSQPWQNSSDEYHEEFNLPNLQETQLLEEKISQASFFALGNVKNAKALRGFYSSLVGLPTPMLEHLPRFKSQLSDIIYDMEMYQSSLDDLQRKMTERKNLLFGILEYQNMKASEFLAARAQISANRMENMTEEMREMTEKTKRETVSMKVIAGVTMFFLPGTFVSTLMSTDIVKWDYENGKAIKRATPAAWYLFLSLTLPLMLVTFAAWILTSWWSNRRDGKEQVGKNEAG